MRKSKILCLHGGTSSAAQFKEQLQIWPSDVLEEMDLVFIDGPFLLENGNFPTFTWYDTQVKYLFHYLGSSINLILIYDNISFILNYLLDATYKFTYIRIQPI